MFGRWMKRGEKHRAAKQQGDVHALDRARDPRGGEQSPDYRFARPDDIVEEDGTMAGPGGSPEDPLDSEARRERDRTP